MPEAGAGHPAGPERLQRFLARAGVGSRRGCEELIRAGRVMVNGVVVREMGTTVVSERDSVRVDGKAIRPQRTLTLMLHKPAGTVTTLKDPEGRRLVTDLLPPGFPRLYPVGRLDYRTEGLLLLTNDGHLALRLSHPRYAVPKVYEVKVKGVPAPEALGRLVTGVRSRGEPLRALRAVRLRVAQKNATLEVVVTEGRHHHVRRLCEAIGHPALKVLRVALGPLRLGDLPRAAFRPLNEAEVRALRELVAAGPARGPRGPARPPRPGPRPPRAAAARPGFPGGNGARRKT
ncbi:MAG TPA: pseudouridine synthase [Candidatus Sulfotelmatobacter sp.]|nr:pseudouridine synthase [Candidatus Sulfotelmatobacter sp.]